MGSWIQEFILISWPHQSSIEYLIKFYRINVCRKRFCLETHIWYCGIKWSNHYDIIRMKAKILNRNESSSSYVLIMTNFGHTFHLQIDYFALDSTLHYASADWENVYSKHWSKSMRHVADSLWINHWIESVLMNVVEKLTFSLESLRTHHEQTHSSRSFIAARNVYDALISSAFNIV